MDLRSYFIFNSISIFFLSYPFKDAMLQELESLHSNQELAIMDLFHSVEKTSEKIEDGCKYTDLLIQHGTGLHYALMRKMISTQLLFLINNTPKPDIHINLDFHSDADAFQEAINKTFGSFVREEPKVWNKELDI